MKSEKNVQVPIVVNNLHVVKYIWLLQNIRKNNKKNTYVGHCNTPL